jgi:cytochrome c biogenesis protein CcdA
VNSGNFALAVVSGMVATVNPCGFALLPAYLGAFVGLDDRRNRASALGRAFAVSAVLTAGFVTVFGLIGVVFGSALAEVQRRAPWLTIVIGVVLALLGVWLLLGRQLTLRIPKLQRGGSDGTLASMYLFGLSYALASLTCAIGPFIGVTSSASGNFVSRLATFALYGVGMGIVITVLTIAAALARSGVANRFRSFLPYMNRVAGGLMVVAGLYVAYYGVYEVRVLEYGADGDDPIIDAALRLQLRLQNLMPNTGNYGWYVLGGAIVIVAAAAWAVRSSKRARPGPPDPPATSDDAPVLVSH